MGSSHSTPDEKFAKSYHKKQQVVNHRQWKKIKHQVFPLLQLPREIREIIYYYALQSHTGHVHALGTTPRMFGELGAPYYFRIYKELSDYDSSNGQQGKSLPPTLDFALSLLRTCSQVHKEAPHFFYIHNIFTLSRPTPQITQIKMVRCIRHIRIYSHITSSNAGPSSDRIAVEKLRTELAILRQFPLLETIIIKVIGDTDPKRFVRCFEIGNGWLLPAIVELFQKERTAWDELLLGEEKSLLAEPRKGQPGKARQLKKEMIMGEDLGHHMQTCGPIMRQMRDAFGGEIWLSGKERDAFSPSGWNEGLRVLKFPPV